MHAMPAHKVVVASSSDAHQPTVAIATPIAKKSTNTADMMVENECHTPLLNLQICNTRLNLRWKRNNFSHYTKTHMKHAKGWQNTHATQYAKAAAATSRPHMTTYAGSSLAQWFLVCLWYDVCRYLKETKY
jgi:hypothetical protein